MAEVSVLANQVSESLNHFIDAAQVACGELTLEVRPENLRPLCFALRDQGRFKFEELVDVCGVDYLSYGVSEWVTEAATSQGFERAVDRSGIALRTEDGQGPRFAVVYHLLSVSLNHRLRIKVFLSEAESLQVDSVVDIWRSANWFEREAFDLYGILFVGHPDLRRILTDYGFVGHPFRKDFPLIGEVEMRYDATLQRVVYEPVSIVPRVLVPKVIREDNRYVANNKGVKGG